MAVEPGDSHETELIRSCKRKSTGAEEKLYKHFFGYAMGVGLRYCLNRDDSLEVVNDAFMKIFSAIHGFNESFPFKPWLRRIVVNCAIDSRRKNRHAMYTEPLDAAAENMPGNFSAIDHLNTRDLLNLLELLPDTLRTVFNMVEIDGYSHEEISKITGIPASSSRVYLSRAKERLRNMLLKSQNPVYGRIG